jgi:hypothetical protein
MNTYVNKYQNYNRIYNLLVKELKKTKTKDIDFIFGSNKTCINKVNDRYLLTYEPSELLRFYKNNDFCDFKGRYKPKSFDLKKFFVVVLYHELGHRLLGHCEYKDQTKNPIYKRLYKKLGKNTVYYYDEVIQKQADIYALNKTKLIK